MDTKQVIVIRTDLNMRKGKMCAQAAHASLSIFTQMMVCNTFGEKDELLQYSFHVPVEGEIENWLNNSFKKIVVGIDSEKGLLDLYSQAREADLPCVIITDSGLTEFNNVPTTTCIAIGPAQDTRINIITGRLKLL